MALTVLDPGFLTTVQDLGRPHFRRLGVPVSGAMDYFALQAANILVSNPPGAAALEISPPGASFMVEADCLIAGAGLGFSLAVNGLRLPLWMSAWVRRGSILRMVYDAPGFWGYLAVSGGLSVPVVLGSRSTYLRGGFGGFMGRALQPEDCLKMGPCENSPLLAGRSLPVEFRPPYARDNLITIQVIPGPQQDAFTPDGMHTFFQSDFLVSETSDRMGYRLNGPKVQHLGKADLLSEGLAPGSIQVAGDGNPLVMMRDSQTVGGYTKIAVVTSTDFPLLAQAVPGSSRVRFTPTDLTQARLRLKQTLSNLQQISTEDDFVGV